MSGTPISNGCLDAYGIYRFLDPGIFGQSYSRFEDKYAFTVTKKDYSIIASYRNQEDFRQCFDFLCLRIGPEVLDLPPISFSDITVEMSAEARRFYDEFNKEFIAYLEDERMSAPNILVKLIRLQGLTSGVMKTDSKGEIVTVHNAKGDALRDILEGLDEPVVVFGRFLHDLAICQATCEELGLKYHQLSGARKELSEWTDVLGVQIRTGALGIDLTKSSIAVFMSTGHSGDDHDQAIARVYRPPQGRPVRIIYIHCKDTIDFKIAQILKDKKNVVEELRKC